MVAQAAPNCHPSAEKKKAETVRAHCQNSGKQLKVYSNQMPDKEKSNLKMVLVFKEISIKMLAEHKPK